MAAVAGQTQAAMDTSKSSNMSRTLHRRAGRCGIDRSQVDFPGIDCTAIDVVAGENVNLVADAHGMARHFAI